LNAIGKGRSRAGTIEAVRSTSVHNGITGSFDLLPSGDPSIGPITVSVAKKTFVPFQVVEPGPSLVKAARHG
jgi:ABC-type branched-subunit amino acid transport system substrate-binding protein